MIPIDTDYKKAAFATLMAYIYDMKEEIDRAVMVAALIALGFDIQDIDRWQIYTELVRDYAETLAKDALEKVKEHNKC